MYAANERLVYRVYHDLVISDSLLSYNEDILQEGKLALCKAIISYDSSRGVPWGRYAYIVIRNAMLSVCRGINNNTIWSGRFDSIDDPDIKSDGPYYDCYYEEDLQKLLTDITLCAPRKSITIGIQGILLHTQGFSTAEIGEMIGYTPSSVRTYMTAARNYIRTNPDTIAIILGS